MIGLYVEGSRVLGLGHLSRISVVYYGLIDHYDVRLYLYGDIVGMAYLEKIGIPYIDCKKDDAEISKHPCWIIDSTTISTNKIVNQLEAANLVILLSPKFDSKFIHYINLALLRSDPFDLNLKNKIIDSRFFIHNTLPSTKTGHDLGVILSGADFSDKLEEIVQLCLNKKEIADNLKSITVLLGSSNFLKFERKSLSSYKIDLKFISALGNVWDYLKDSELVIVGNGIVVEEAITENKNCIVYMYSKDNQKLKLNDNLVRKVKAVKSKSELEKSLIEELTNYETKIRKPLYNKVQNFLIQKILHLLYIYKKTSAI